MYNNTKKAGGWINSDFISCLGSPTAPHLALPHQVVKITLERQHHWERKPIQAYFSKLEPNSRPLWASISELAQLRVRSLVSTWSSSFAIFELALCDLISKRDRYSWQVFADATSWQLGHSDPAE